MLLPEISYSLCQQPLCLFLILFQSQAWISSENAVGTGLLFDACVTLAGAVFHRCICARSEISTRSAGAPIFCFAVGILLSSGFIKSYHAASTFLYQVERLKGCLRDCQGIRAPAVLTSLRFWGIYDFVIANFQTDCLSTDYSGLY
jgi:hypothetical protein